MLRIIYAMFLLIALTFTQIPTAYLAAAPVSQTPRFVDIQSNDFVIAQFDTQTIKYEKDPYRDELLVNVWVKSVPNEWTGNYQLSHYIFRMNAKEIMLLDQANFNGTSQMVSTTTKTYDPNSWMPVIPETPAEHWYATIMKYVQENDKKLKTDYNNAQGVVTHKNTLGSLVTPILNFFSI